VTVRRALSNYFYSNSTYSNAPSTADLLPPNPEVRPSATALTLAFLADTITLALFDDEITVALFNNSITLEEL